MIRLKKKRIVSAWSLIERSNGWNTADMAITRTGHALGRRLRRLRTSAGMSLRQVAATCIVTTPSTLLRLEDGETTRLTFPAIGALARLYGAPPELCVELEEMYKAAQRDKPWGDSFIDSAVKGFSWFLEMEAQAAVLKIFEPNLVTGLLQTTTYSRNLHLRHDAPSETIDAWLAMGAKRNERMWSRDPLPTIQVLMGEWALLGAVDDEQRDRLNTADAEVRVLATADGPFPFLRGPFVLFSFPEADDEPDCLYTEGLEGSRYDEGQATTSLYHRIFDQAYSRATPIEEFQGGHFSLEEEQQEPERGCMRRGQDRREAHPGP